MGETDPVQLRPSYVHGYSVVAIQTERCDVKTTATYSCISVEFVLERASSYHVVTMYIPYSMLVCLSWLAFWVDQKNILTRVVITLSVLLIMLEKSERGLEKVPNVAYTKAVDV